MPAFGKVTVSINVHIYTHADLDFDTERVIVSFGCGYCQ
jgi:hypothetical protein